MTAAPRPRRDCVCPRARHQHGTRRAYDVDRCRCLLCRAAHANATRAYRAGGTWREAYVDAKPTRQRLRALARVGVTSRRVAAHTGLTIEMVTYLRIGKPAQITPRLAVLVERAYGELWLRGRADANARRCSTQARTAGYAPSYGIDEDEENDCGTHAAYRLHRIEGEPIDEACAVAEREYQRDMKQRQRARKKAAA